MMQFTLTREQFEAKRAAAQQHGLRILGDAGRVSKWGVTVDYKYDADVLTLEPHRSFLCPFPEAKIDEMINGFFA